MYSAMPAAVCWRAQKFCFCCVLGFTLCPPVRWKMELSSCMVILCSARAWNRSRARWSGVACLLGEDRQKCDDDDDRDDRNNSDGRKNRRARFPGHRLGVGRTRRASAREPRLAIVGERRVAPGGKRRGASAGAFGAIAGGESAGRSFHGVMITPVRGRAYCDGRVATMHFAHACGERQATRG